VAEPLRRKKRAQPVNHSEFPILLALADGDRHGYGIMQEVTEKSGGTVQLGPGTLYGAINRMLKTGLIEESPRCPSPKTDDARRSCYYRLTRVGRSVAREESQRLASLVQVAASKRLLTGKGIVVAPGR